MFCFLNDPSVHLSVHLSCKINSLRYEPILMKLYTDEFYDQSLCMKKNYPDLNYFKGDN